MIRHGTIGLRAIVTALAFIVLTPTLLVVVGGYLPWLPVVGRFGGLIGPSLPGLAIAASAAAVLSLISVRMGGAAFNRALATLAVATLVGTALIVGQVWSFAGGLGAPIDLARAALPAAATRAGDPPVPDRTETFPTTDGTLLRAEVWNAAGEADGGSGTGVAGPGVVWVHGGGFVGGGLGSRPEFFNFLADAGIAVVDVEYRLSPPPRWDQAAPDVLCALAWVGDHGADLGIDPARIVLVGDSSGGNLALIAAWAPRTAGAYGSCQERAPVPAGVVAVAPAADLAGIWQDDTIIATGQRFPEAYVGGTPTAFPDRYLAASPLSLIRADVPPTLLVTGANDQLVRPERTIALGRLLADAGATCRILVVPFSDHGFDSAPNGYGAQIEEAVLPAWIEAPLEASTAPGSRVGC